MLDHSLLTELVTPTFQTTRARHLRQATPGLLIEAYDYIGAGPGFLTNMVVSRGGGFARGGASPQWEDLEWAGRLRRLGGDRSPLLLGVGLRGRSWDVRRRDRRTLQSRARHRVGAARRVHERSRGAQPPNGGTELLAQVNSSISSLRASPNTHLAPNSWLNTVSGRTRLHQRCAWSILCSGLSALTERNTTKT